MTNKKQTLKQLLNKLSKAIENVDTDLQNELIFEIEANLDFRTEEQHEEWLNMSDTWLVWEDFYNFTLSIGFKKEYKKADLFHILSRKDCAGVIVKSNESENYWFQNANDMGFYFELSGMYNEYEECRQKETILRKIKIAKRLFIYELAYNENNAFPEEECLSYEEATSFIKSCYKHVLNA